MYFVHRFQTFIIACIILLSGIALERISPVFGIVCGGMFILYIVHRGQKIFAKKVKDRHPDVAETNKFIDNFNYSASSYNHSAFNGASNHCKTCGAGYYSLGNPTCNEKGIPEHCVEDTPPHNNPYEFWWYQLNGYPPPTIKKSMDDFNFDRVYFLKEGKKYYSEHNNAAWDMGVVDPPSWYVSESIAKMM